jgi:hypothetical protein
MSGKKAFFMQRLNDHIQYLDKVTRTIKGKMEFAGTDCHCCKLGQWIYAEGREEVSLYAPAAMPLFEQLVEKHEYFHVISNTILAQFHAGDISQIHQEMTEVHKLSNQLVSILLDIDRYSRQSSAA